MDEQALPPGAISGETDDDIDIKVSEGEFLVPANVVRFLGLDKLEKMVSKANEQLAEMEATGRIGGSSPDDDLPFPPEELETTDVEEAPASPPAFAEGGMVGGEGIMANNPFDQGGGFTGVKPMKSADGKQTIFIPYQDGKPLYTIPEGYSDAPTETKQEATPDAAGSTVQPSPTMDINGKAADYDNQPRNEMSPLARDPKSWSVDNFVSFGQQQAAPGGGVVRNMMNVIPGINLASKIQESYLNSQTANLFDQMLETGVDLQGNAIPQNKMLELQATKATLQDQMSQQTGLNLNPIAKLGDAVGKWLGFRGDPPAGAAAPVSGANSANTSSMGTAARPGNSDNEGKDYTSRSTVGSDGTITEQSRPMPRGGGTAAPATNSPSAPPQDQNSGGSRARGNASAGFGGMGYRKGGLVTRRNKP